MPDISRELPLYPVTFTLECKRCWNKSTHPLTAEISRKLPSGMLSQIQHYAEHHSTCPILPAPTDGFSSPES